ncbi:AzlC family ABC transporter permease [Bacillus chungangensis]|uniref:4-azaleucine resistance transporter AzlC n=1 Tax=Bacillus chungangensis TaxID=587633 RepID=A0ABT9WTW7_9BACI|nr:AzlC family ABC transporter permease [Bacillus chungangensis]MDQ0176660.1 4-azaleucine resistance transporter AzlC [Bacillus chungangensis]
MKRESSIVIKQEDGSLQEENQLLQGVKDCVPTLLGYLSIGFAAGVVQNTAGLSILEIAMMSLFLYAGSAQFIAAGMFASGAPVLSIILTIFIVNLRHFLLSAALAPHFRRFPTWQNMINGFLLTDETFGVASNHLASGKQATYSWLLGLNVTAYLNWLVANLAGAYFGNWITNPEAFGLDFALPAMFVGLLVLQMAVRSKLAINLFVAGCAILFTIGASFLLPKGIDILFACILAATLGTVMKKWN